MENLLTQETPGKVIGFTISALFSMALLFGVSFTNASFQGAEYSLPNPFAPEKVVAVIDKAAASYSSSLASFSQPAREALAVHTEGMKWIMEEASGPLLSTLGLQSLAYYQEPKAQQSQVAGAFTLAGEYDTFNVNSLFAALIGEP